MQFASTSWAGHSEGEQLDPDDYLFTAQISSGCFTHSEDIELP